LERVSQFEFLKRLKESINGVRDSRTAANGAKGQKATSSNPAAF
jgi:hypothetical protein